MTTSRHKVALVHSQGSTRQGVTGLQLGGGFQRLPSSSMPVSREGEGKKSALSWGAPHLRWSWSRDAGQGRALPRMGR